MPADSTMDAAGTANRGALTSALPTPFDPLVRAGDVVLASTLITNDSDTPGPVVVQIRSGPLRGARLLGGFERNRDNTHLVVQFSSMVLNNGSEVPVSAYAVDARQKSLAVRTNLDRRLFARFAPRVAAAFVSGVGETLSDPGTSLIDLGGVTGVTRPAQPSNEAFTRDWQRSETTSQVSLCAALPKARSSPYGPGRSSACCSRAMWISQVWSRSRDHG